MYSEKHFAACLFNPLQVDGLMANQYPRLKEIIKAEWIEESGEALIDQIIRYEIMLWDKHSPLRNAERDLQKRRNIAYDLAGLPRDKSGEPIEDLINETRDICFGFTVAYLARFIRQKEYAALCALEFKYYENILELMTPIKGDTNAERLDAQKKKSFISGDILTDIKNIDELWLLFFGEKEMVEMVKRKKFKPEEMV